MKPFNPSANVILSSLLDGYIKPSVTNAELAVIIGCHPRTANRHLTSLATRGLVRIERHPPNGAGLGTDPSGRRIYPTEAATVHLGRAKMLPAQNH